MLSRSARTKGHVVVLEFGRLMEKCSITGWWAWVRETVSKGLTLSEHCIELLGARLE